MNSFPSSIDPSRLSPLAPFWFWNGDLQPDELVRQLSEMDSQGVKGVIVCARQGLKVPYLSQGWFDRVRLVAAEAARRSMDLWLYDEQPYPSLAGGGRVALEHPEFEAREMHWSSFDVEPGQAIERPLGFGRSICLRAYPLDDQGRPVWEQGRDLANHVGMLFDEEVFHETGLTAYNRKRFLACTPYDRLDWTAPPDHRWRVFAFREIPVRDHKYYDKFVDPLNPQAVKFFLETTHDRYAQELAPWWGTTVKGMFTDEIHPIGFEGEGIPWSPRLPGVVQEKTGWDLSQVLPALVDDGFPRAAQIRYDFMTTVVDQFIASYDVQVHEWCQNHGILFIGEKPILRSAQLDHFDIPGIDAGHQKAGGLPEAHPARYRANPRILASAARLAGRERCLCEAFHSIGWGMDLQDMKWTYDWLALQGVNLFVNHAYYYTTQALTKHDAPPSSFLQMPWWKHQKQLSDYVGALVQVTDFRRRHPRLLLVDPVTSSWTVAYGQAELRKTVLEAFAETQRLLFEAHLDFWIIDPRTLAAATIDVGSGRPALVIADQRYEGLIVPPVRNLEAVAVEAIQVWAKTGGQVWTCGGPTEAIDSKAVPVLPASWTGSVHDLPDALDRAGYRDVSVRENGREAPVFAQRFEGPSGPWAVVQNPLATPRTVEVRFREDRGTPGRERVLGPFETVVVGTSDPARLAAPRRHVLDLAVPGTLRAWGPNVVRLDDWDLSVDGGITWAQVKARPLVDQLHNGHVSLPLTRKDRFGTPKTLVFPGAQARYRCRFTVSGPLPRELWREPDGLLGDATVRLNGTELPAALWQTRREQGLVIEACAVVGAVLPGENLLEITVTATRSGQGLRNPLYLAGDFSVAKKDGWNLGPAVDVGTLVELTKGLRHYAGDLSWTTEIRPGLPGPQELAITDPDYRLATQLLVNGRDLGVRAWHPFVWPLPQDLDVSQPLTVELRVSTTRIGYFEGQTYEAAQDRYISVEEA